LVSFATAAQAQRSTVRRPAPAAERKRISDDARMRGFSLGAYTVAAPGLTVTGNDLDGSVKTSFGPGAGIMLGYGFNRIWSAFASLDVAKQSASAGDYDGSFGLVHFEVGARANLAYGSPTNLPYVSASYGRRALGARVTDEFDGTTYDASLSGGMLGLGGGIQHALSPALTLDGGMELGFGRFSHFDWDGESGTADMNGSTSVRFKFGVVWRPTTRRPS
jgi:hypothetical protein